MARKMISAELARKAIQTLDWRDEPDIKAAREEIVDKVIYDIDWHINRIIHTKDGGKEFCYFTQSIENYIKKHHFKRDCFTGSPTIQSVLYEDILSIVTDTLTEHVYNLYESPFGIMISWRKDSQR